MAGGDYYDCDCCGRGKIFYDANVDWESFGERIGQIRVTCSNCYKQGVRISFGNKSSPTSENMGVHRWTLEENEAR